MVDRPRREPGQDDWVLIVCATKKLLQRVGPPTLPEGEQSTTLLGQWYATALFWIRIAPGNSSRPP